MERAGTQMERDIELINSLQKLDDTKLAIWGYFSGRADNLAEHLWMTGTWMLGIVGAVLTLPFVAGFIVADSNYIIHFESRLFTIFICVFGLVVCGYSYVALKDMRDHIAGNWRRSDFVRAGQWEKATWGGQKLRGWVVLIIFGVGAILAFIFLIALALFWP